jgi:hypothetical protein
MNGFYGYGSAYKTGQTQIDFPHCVFPVVWRIALTPRSLAFFCFQPPHVFPPIRVEHGSNRQWAQNTPNIDDTGTSTLDNDIRRDRFFVFHWFVSSAKSFACTPGCSAIFQSEKICNCADFWHLWIYLCNEKRVCSLVRLTNRADKCD